ncbi:MAG: hypothetical protein V3U02_06655, partial [Calditrichia bacterium]
MAGLISRIKGIQALTAGMALVLLQGLLGVEHALLTLGIVGTGVVFALMDISKVERMGWMVFIIFLAVVGIGGLSKVPIIPALWA